MNIFDFVRETEDLETSISFAVKLGLLPDRQPRTCLKCGKGSVNWCKASKVLNLPYSLVCSRRPCRSTTSLGRNTIFYNLKFPISKALRLIYFWLLKISSSETADQLQLRENLVIEWFKTFKEVCAFVIINYTKAIGGPDHSVEISEYQILTKNESHNIWLFAGIDRNTGHNFVVHVENLDIETLWVILKNYVLPGTVVVTRKAQELSELERGAGSDLLTFVHPQMSPRTDTHCHLDTMFTELKEYVDKETPQDQLSYKELYAYKFLYFNRDGLCNVPVSEVIHQFVSDVKLVFPGF